MKQHLLFGQYLRNRYNDTLSTYYNRNQVFARSTDYDRTLMSTYSLLSGLYPPQDYQKFDETLNDWQPIAVHTTDKSTDMVRFLVYFRHLQFNIFSKNFNSYSIKAPVLDMTS